MPKSKNISLALQGGGSHGALTWGVLDRLLEDGRVNINAISGTSAGAMNAVALADGFRKNGRDGARETLEKFWKSVSEAAMLSPIKRSLWMQLTGDYSLNNSPYYLAMDHLTRIFSPYEMNPMDINPLRDLVTDLIDFDSVNACDQLKVYVTATNVRTGRARVFNQSEISVDSVMASACLPFMFKAVEIQGEHYWDGGYIGNPALYPLVELHECQDIVIVQINPMVRSEVPKTSREILNRINEITFNSSLVKELRAIELLHQLIEAGEIDSERYRDMRIHIINENQQLEALDASSKLNAEWDFLTMLRDKGREWASLWLDAHFDQIGQSSTFDISSLFEDTFHPIDLQNCAMKKA